MERLQHVVWSQPPARAVTWPKASKSSGPARRATLCRSDTMDERHRLEVLSALFSIPPTTPPPPSSPFPTEDDWKKPKRKSVDGTFKMADFFFWKGAEGWLAEASMRNTNDIEDHLFNFQQLYVLRTVSIYTHIYIFFLS